MGSLYDQFTSELSKPTLSTNQSLPTAPQDAEADKDSFMNELMRAYYQSKAGLGTIFDPEGTTVPDSILEAAKYAPSPARQAAINKIVTREDPTKSGFREFLSDAMANPEALGTMLVEQIPNLAATVGLGVATGGAGVAAGTAAKLAPKAVQSLGKLGAVTGIGTAAGIQDAGSTILEILNEGGIDMSNPEELRWALSNPDIMGPVNKAATARGITTGALTAASAGLLGRLGAGNITLPKAVGLGGLGVGLDAGSEAAAQLVENKEIYSPEDVYLEGALSLPGTALDVGVTRYVGRDRTPEAQEEQQVSAPPPEVLTEQDLIDVQEVVKTPDQNFRDYLYELDLPDRTPPAKIDVVRTQEADATTLVPEKSAKELTSEVINSGATIPSEFYIKDGKVRKKGKFGKVQDSYASKTELKNILDGFSTAADVGPATQSASTTPTRANAEALAQRATPKDLSPEEGRQLREQNTRDMEAWVKAALQTLKDPTKPEVKVPVTKPTKAVGKAPNKVVEAAKEEVAPAPVKGNQQPSFTRAIITTTKDQSKFVAPVLYTSRKRPNSAETTEVSRGVVLGYDDNGLTVGDSGYKASVVVMDPKTGSISHAALTPNMTIKNPVLFDGTVNQSQVFDATPEIIKAIVDTQTDMEASPVSVADFIDAIIDNTAIKDTSVEELLGRLDVGLPSVVKEQVQHTPQGKISNTVVDTWLASTLDAIKNPLYRGFMGAMSHYAGTNWVKGKGNPFYARLLDLHQSKTTLQTSLANQMKERAAAYIQKDPKGFVRVMEALDSLSYRFIPRSEGSKSQGFEVSKGKVEYLTPEQTAMFDSVTKSIKDIIGIRVYQKMSQTLTPSAAKIIPAVNDWARRNGQPTLKIGSNPRVPFGYDTDVDLIQDIRLGDLSTLRAYAGDPEVGKDPAITRAIKQIESVLEDASEFMRMQQDPTAVIPLQNRSRGPHHIILTNRDGKVVYHSAIEAGKNPTFNADYGQAISVDQAALIKELQRIQSYVDKGRIDPNNLFTIDGVKLSQQESGGRAVVNFSPVRVIPIKPKRNISSADTIVSAVWGELPKNVKNNARVKAALEQVSNNKDFLASQHGTGKVTGDMQGAEALDVLMESVDLDPIKSTNSTYIPGSDPNYISSFLDFIDNNIAEYAREKYRYPIKELFDQVTATIDPSSDMFTRFEETKNDLGGFKQSALEGKLRSFQFFYALGANISSMVTQIMAPLYLPAHVQSLLPNGIPGVSTKSLNNMVNSMMKGGAVKDVVALFARNVPPDVEKSELVKLGRKLGFKDPTAFAAELMEAKYHGMLHSAFQVEAQGDVIRSVSGSRSIRAIGEGNKPTPISKALDFADTKGDQLGKIYGLSEVFSRMITTISMLKILQDQKVLGDMDSHLRNTDQNYVTFREQHPYLSPRLAVVRNVINDLHSIGGKINRPKLASGTVGALLMPFQGPLANLMGTILVNQSKLSPLSRSKYLAILLLTTWAIGGIEGMPGYRELWANIYEGFKKAGGVNSSSYVDLRTAFASIMGDELAKLAMEGPLDYITGVDFGQRMSLSMPYASPLAPSLRKILGLDSYGSAQSAMDLTMPTAVVSKGVEAAQRAEGSLLDVLGAAASAAAPVQIGNINKATSLATEGNVDNLIGVPVLPKGQELEGLSAISAAIKQIGGFTPTEIKEERMRTLALRMKDDKYAPTFQSMQRELKGALQDKEDADKSGDGSAIIDANEALKVKELEIAEKLKEIASMDPEARVKSLKDIKKAATQSMEKEELGAGKGTVTKETLSKYGDIERSVYE